MKQDFSALINLIDSESKSINIDKEKDNIDSIDSQKTDTHDFIHQYRGLGAFGMNRETDEETLMFYLQKFSEDSFMKAFVPRLNSEDLEQIYNMVNFFLKKYFSEDEYHDIFLKDR